MRLIFVYVALCFLGLTLVRDTDAAEYFERYVGTNVWARTSFRIREQTSVKECAEECIANRLCSSFIYSRKTKYCYGRKSVNFRNRRRWQPSRRYDYYHKLTGHTRARVQETLGDSGRNEVIFVRRQQGTSEYRVITPSDGLPATTVETTTKDVTAAATTTTRVIDKTTTPALTARPMIAKTTTPASTTTTVVAKTTTPASTTTKVVAKTTTPASTRERRTTTTATPKRKTTAATGTITTTSRRVTTRKGTTSTLPPVVEHCDRPIGLEDGTVPYDQITASSYFWRFTPSNVGINSGNGWMASSTDVGEYIEIDIGRLKSVVAVATQGSSYLFSSEFVSEYKIRFLFHRDGIFETYKEGGRERIFTGNSDSTTIKKHRLSRAVHAYKIQFHPLKFNRYIMMRAEVYEAC